jgi:hypothetical protein
LTSPGKSMEPDRRRQRTTPENNGCCGRANNSVRPQNLLGLRLGRGRGRDGKWGKPSLDRNTQRREVRHSVTVLQGGPTHCGMMMMMMM